MDGSSSQNHIVFPNLRKPRRIDFQICHHEFPMTVKAVVFDAYGTLYDIQSVAEITEDAFPGYGEIITQV